MQQSDSRRAEGESADRSDAVIEVDGLTKVYGDGDDSVTAVDDLSFRVERGEIVGLLGPNGAGKTTTIKSALGLLIPTSGTVEIDSYDVHDQTRQAYRSVAAVLEGARNNYWRLTVRENLQFFALLQGLKAGGEREWHDELLETLGLSEKADEPVRALSRGMKQKLALACALARRTPVVFLDEPTLGLDIETSYNLRTELRRLADEENKTVVLSSHDMDVVQDLCDRVIIIDGGSIVVDDEVEALTSVFEKRTYELVFEGHVGESARSHVESAFEVTEWTTLAENTSFEILLDDPDLELEDFLDRLDHDGLTLVSASPVEPDLEDVFLAETDSNQVVARR